MPIAALGSTPGPLTPVVIVVAVLRRRREMAAVWIQGNASGRTRALSSARKRALKNMKAL